MLAFGCWIKRPRQIVGREEGFVWARGFRSHSPQCPGSVVSGPVLKQTITVQGVECRAARLSAVRGREGMPVIGSLLAILSVLVLWERCHPHSVLLHARVNYLCRVCHIFRALLL